MARFIDLSHEIHDGLVTYPGLASPSIRPDMTFDASHDHYAAGYEFQIDRIEMISNTGTYIDTPAHRIRNGPDLADLELATVAGLDVVVVRLAEDATTIGPAALAGLDPTGRAVLFATGWDRHWGTAAYGVNHPHLGTDTAHALVEAQCALVGIDSLNVDGTTDGTRPIHTALLNAGIPILEHLTNLAGLPDTGAVLYAVPPKIRGMGSFPVRAFCVVD
jgi:kynurenine formamidase